MAADRTNVVIKATDVTGKQVSTTINYANPNAANITLKTMGQMMNALTTNEYIQTNRTDITVLDTAPPTPADKQTPTLAIDGGNTISAGGENNVSKAITYNGDGVLYASAASTQNSVMFGIKNTASGSTLLLCTKPADLTGGSATGTLYASEGTNYKAASIEFTFTY